MLKRSLLLSILITSFFVACSTPDKSEEITKTASLVQHPDWSKNANIYEVNIRQYSEEGTFEAFRKDLPRLKEMGVKILWLMPIHPIGVINRKETEESRGSYYSVADYKDVNPNFGTKEDFKRLVDNAHELGFKLIIDWVANHTAWDNPWTENKDWFELNEEGNFTPPHGTDWSDVIQLNYENQEMRAAMIDALEYWVTEFDIDGYRCDVAGMVPTDFWETARVELDKIKPVFMLAEDGEPELLHKAFDMNYAWEYAHVIREIAKGEQTFHHLDSLFERDSKRFPDNAYRMYFTSNHDENSWNGTDPEMYGKNFENFAVLSATVKGMPLIYNGQESILDKRLEFFEKDEIEWKNYQYEDFYRMLLSLNTTNKALWNGANGGETVRISSPEGTYAFTREKDGHKIMVAINNNNEAATIDFPSLGYDTYAVYGTLEGTEEFDTVELPAHNWIIVSTLN